MLSSKISTRTFLHQIINFMTVIEDIKQAEAEAEALVTDARLKAHATLVEAEENARKKLQEEEERLQTWLENERMNTRTNAEAEVVTQQAAAERVRADLAKQIKERREQAVAVATQAFNRLVK